MGCLSILCPSIDKVNPSEVIKTLKKYNCNVIMGSPAFTEKLALYVQRNNLTLPVEYVVAGGAPVYKSTLRTLAGVTSNQSTYVLYGSTEAEPISTITAEEKMKLEVGGHVGHCVGKPIFEGTVKIIKIVEGKYGVYIYANVIDVFYCSFFLSVILHFLNGHFFTIV